MNFPRLTGSDSVASTNGATTATHSARPVHATCFLRDDSLPGWNYVTHTAYIDLRTSMPFIRSIFHSYSSHLSPWFIRLEKHSIRTSYCRRAGYKFNTNTLLSIPQHQQNSTKIHQQPRNCGKTTIIFYNSRSLQSDQCHHIFKQKKTQKWLVYLRFRRNNDPRAPT